MPHSHRHHHERRDIWDDMNDWFHDPFGDNKDNGNGQRDTNSGDGGHTTLIHTVYKTLAPTFQGPVAGYSTMGQDAKPTETPSPTKKADPKPTPEPKLKESTSIPSAIRNSASTTAVDSILAKATGNPTISQTASLGDQLLTPTSSLSVATSTPTAESTTSKDSGDGTSAGAKAGIAFGVLGGVFIVGLVAFLLFNRRRRQAAAQREADNEKSHGSANPFDTMTIRSDPHAPRISLRPVTQFLPNWNLDKRTSKGAGMALNSAAAGAHGQNKGMWERPATSQSTHPANPFGNQAERVHEPTIEEHSAIPPSDPFTANGPAIAAGAAVGVAAGAAAGAGLMRKTSMRKDSQRNVDLTIPPTLGSTPPSPAGTEFSMSSVSPGAPMPPSSGAAAIAAAGGPANSNVHRVQLDFKPSLDDEMGLKAGDLVRLLHEYDDGWALVILLDRSQQGVVPRTCLSTRPVKPRAPQGAPRPGLPVNPSGHYPRGPNGPHSPPGQRPMTPQGRPMTPQGRPMTPQGRPMTPQGMPPQGRPRMHPGGPGGPGPRPMSPAGRSQSPGPRYNGPPGHPVSRPQSPSGMNRPTGPLGPPGPSPMNNAQSPPPGPSPNGPPTGPVGRKPVPGQAY